MELLYFRWEVVVVGGMLSIIVILNVDVLKLGLINLMRPLSICCRWIYCELRLYASPYSLADLILILLLLYLLHCIQNMSLFVLVWLLLWTVVLLVEITFIRAWFLVRLVYIFIIFQYILVCYILLSIKLVFAGDGFYFCFKSALGSVAPPHGDGLIKGELVGEVQAEELMVTK